MSNTDPIPLTKAQREFVESIPPADNGFRAMQKISVEEHDEKTRGLKLNLEAELLVGGTAMDSVLGKPSVDLSNRPRRRMITEQPVCSQDLAESSAVVVELLSQLPPSESLTQHRVQMEALRYARHVASVLMKAKAEGLAENAAMADSLACASIHAAGAIDFSARPDAKLDGSIDPERWAMAFHAAPDEKQKLSEWFARAIGAGIATGRVREREVMIEEMKPVFRNLEILDMWADRMNVKGGERGLALHQDPDARRWAREFLEVIDQLERKEGHKLCDPATFDEGWLISWFANAMMASYDWAMAQRDRQDALKARHRDVHVFGPLLFTTILQGANAPLFDSSTSRTEKGEVFHGLAIRVQPWKREHGQPAPQLAVVVAWRRSPGPGLFARWRGKMRLMYGFCPCCNSDAPEVDRCEVCLGYQSADGLCEFPPNAARKAVWRKRWMEGKGVRPSEGQAFCPSDSAASNVEGKPDMPQTAEDLRS